jgi:fatty acid omega-hydroxy dehydrogenase
VITELLISLEKKE